MRPINRIAPVLPVGAMQTYQVIAPVSTHWRDATCVEVDCQHHLRGWRTVVDESTTLGQGQAYYIRHDRTRSHTEEKLASGLTQFTFKPGQNCFTKHRVRVPKPEIYIVRDGDWRGNPTGRRRVHTNARDWVEDFGEHQLTVEERVKRG
jgi:hypothetical protein